METVKTIKDVDDRTWAQFKSIAAANNAKAGQMFKIIIDDYQKRAAGWWDGIFSRKSTLSKKDADEFKAHIREMRKELGWRT